jgi:hypothetical protein
MFVKDPSTKVIINTDDSYYNSIVALRHNAKKEQSMVHQMNELQDELTEIKQLLQQVLDGRTYG